MGSCPKLKLSVCLSGFCLSVRVVGSWEGKAPQQVDYTCHGHPRDTTKMPSVSRARMPMMKNPLSLLLSCLLASAVAKHEVYVDEIASKGICPEDYHADPATDPDWVYSPFGKCLRDATVEWNKRTWQGCKEVCQNGIYCSQREGRRLGYCTGSTLATVESEAEEEWLAAEFLSNPNRSSTPGDIWIGFGYIDTASIDSAMPKPAAMGDGSWMWMSGNFWSEYRNWATEPPPLEGCAILADSPSSGWHVQSCSTKARCVCELTPHQPPAPPTPPPPDSVFPVWVLAVAAAGIFALIIGLLLLSKWCKSRRDRSYSRSSSAHASTSSSRSAACSGSSSSSSSSSGF